MANNIIKSQLNGGVSVCHQKRIVKKIIKITIKTKTIIIQIMRTINFIYSKNLHYENTPITL